MPMTVLQRGGPRLEALWTRRQKDSPEPLALPTVGPVTGLAQVAVILRQPGWHRGQMDPSLTGGLGFLF